MGHELVAELASRELTDAARQEVRALLDGRGMASVAAWADEIRGQRPQTRPWHFVNIPLEASGYEPFRDCARSNCIVAALDQQLAILRDRSRSRVARGEALRFVIHLVGDLHQPLHCADRNDRGGNQMSVRWFGRKSTLHRVWDQDVLTHAQLSGPQQTARLAEMVRQLPGREQVVAGTPVDWANEAHEIAARVAYAIPEDAELEYAYYERAAPAAYFQLVRAGLRLGRVLNEALSQPAEAAGSGVQTPAARPVTVSCVPVEHCCKLCSAGQACGATCISAAYTCHVGRGCACNASEICAGN